MRMCVRPAKRDGNVKELFDRRLAKEDVSTRDGGVSLSIVARDMYAKGSNYHYTITLTHTELAALADAAR